LSDPKSEAIEKASYPVFTRIAFYGYVDGKEVLLHLTDTLKGYVAIPNVHDVLVLGTALDQPIAENKRMMVSNREYLFSFKPNHTYVRIHCYSLEQGGPSFWTNKVKVVK
jgi:hypothetical protein